MRSMAEYRAEESGHNGPGPAKGMAPCGSRKAQRNAVAEKITSLERTFYGRGPRNVQVSVSDDDPVSLVVLSIDSLTVADAVLGERGHREAVIRHHEALHEATRADFLDAVEGIVGQPRPPPTSPRSTPTPATRSASSSSPTQMHEARLTAAELSVGLPSIGRVA